mmetsp:Transcript_84698/g.263492  ORF Transcript_84698/g.263492 Transcript_84698/m.263492 type:complete len:212 (+) Transcript_84698:107-742(+)
MRRSGRPLLRAAPLPRAPVVACVLHSMAVASFPGTAGVGKGRVAVADDALGPRAVADAPGGVPAPLVAQAPRVPAGPGASLDGGQAHAIVHLLAVPVELMRAVHALRPGAVRLRHALQVAWARPVRDAVVAARQEGRRRREGAGPVARGRRGLPHLLVHHDAIPWETLPRTVHALRPRAVCLLDASGTRGAGVPARRRGAAADIGMILLLF